MVLRSVLLRMADSKRLERFARGNRFSFKTRSRFVAGETIESITPPVRELNLAGISATLDYLGESVKSRQEVEATVGAYQALFKHIATDKLNANVSLKLTALGLDVDEELCYSNMCELLTTAGKDQFVRIDMEGSAYTQRTLNLFYRLWNEGGFRNVGVVIQAYLHRSERDVEDLITLQARVRLCKGAYKEPPNIAFASKADVDDNYVRLMKRLVSDGNYPGIATHDPRIILTTLDYISANKIPPDRYEFQMLYGIRRDLQTKLVKDGHQVRVYVPFGTHWYPYFMRRLAERPSNLWFVLKNMFKS